MDGVSWWQSVPELSLGLVDATGIEVSDPVIDVGAGWSTLVDHLCERGYRDLTAIDLSATALATVRDRLGPDSDHVVLHVADVLDLDRGRRYRLWHDRECVLMRTKASMVRQGTAILASPVSARVSHSAAGAWGG